MFNLHRHGAGVAILMECPEGSKAVKHKISNEQAEQGFGVELAHERMENGELRFRLFGDDGNGYIRTVATSTGGWQNSHSHTAFRELYLVEFGWLGMATPKGPGVAIKIFPEGRRCISPMGQIHNIYLCPDAVIHTIKFGIRGAVSRFDPAPDFNSLTQHLTEQDVLAIAKSGAV